MIIDKRLLPIDDLYVLKIGGYILKNVLMAGLISVSVSSLIGGYRAETKKQNKINVIIISATFFVFCCCKLPRQTI